MSLALLENDLLRHIAQSGHRSGDRLQPLDELAPALGISVGKLREQLEVAKLLGVVTVRPRTGMLVESFDFLPAIKTSLLFALARDPHQFEAFSQLRNHVEFSYFDEAVARLTRDDHARLREIVAIAWMRLNGSPIRIPDHEHRELHLAIFSRLDNPFVKGLLEAYWEGYAAVGLNVFSDYSYLCEVWRYHEDIVTAIAAGEVETARKLLIVHTKLLQQRDARGSRPKSPGRAKRSEAIPA